YQASSSIYVVSASNNSIVNLTDLQIGSQLTADYQELMLSRPLRVSVRDRDGQDAGAAGVADADLLFQLAICNVKVEVLDDV
ncbi:hypothetical protein ACSNNV_17015, partial [Faecalibacterium prausnitzii]